MSDPWLIPAAPDESDGWTRPRVIFLSISAALLVSGLYLVSEVLLPFVLAIVIAYVLAPLVELCERRVRISSGWAVLAVYTVVLGSLALVLTWLSPLIYDETVSIARESPTLLKDAADRYGPALENFVNETIGSRPDAPVAAPAPAATVRAAADGSLALEVGSGVDVIADGDNHLHVRAADDRTPARFEVSHLIDQAVLNFQGYVKKHAFEVLHWGQVIIGSLARFIFLLFMVLMVAGYLLHTRARILEFFRGLVPQRHRSDWDFLLRRVDRGLAGVIRGQLLICLVNGLLSALGFWLFDLKYWPVLSLLAGGLSIIPVFGAILSSVPAVAIGLTQGFSTALWVLLWILGIHQLEANLLNPKIIGVSAKIHPVLVVFSLLTGEHYFGLWGALLAVPVLSITQSVFNHFRFATLPDAGPDSMHASELAKVSRPG